MLDITYSPRWAECFEKRSPIIGTRRMSALPTQPAHDSTSVLDWHTLRQHVSTAQSQASSALNQSSETIMLAQQVIDNVLNYYDQSDCLFGLFQLDKQAKQLSASPFLATRCYCVKVNSITERGYVNATISPIYLLGPDYPEQHKLRHGKALEENAIIGLVDMAAANMQGNQHRKYSLGIDAGIVFKDSDIAHNHVLEIQFNITKNGFMTTLQCMDQTTSRHFSWRELDLVWVDDTVAGTVSEDTAS